MKMLKNRLSPEEKPVLNGRTAGEVLNRLAWRAGFAQGERG
jgi:hypothetical protein